MAERRVREERAPYGDEDRGEGDAYSAADAPAFERLLFGRVVSFKVILGKATGSPLAGLLLSQFGYWTPRSARRDGWFWKTADEIFDETSLTRRNQETARKILSNLGLVEEELRGLPAKLWFRVNVAAVEALVAQYRMAEPDEQVCTDPPNLDGGIRQGSEITPESTYTRSFPRTSVEPPHTGDEPARVSRGGAEQRITEAWTSAFGRPPAPAELAGLRRWLRQDPAFRETPSSQLADLFSVTRHETRARDDAVAVARARFRDGPASWHTAPPRADGWAVPEVTVPESAITAMRRRSPGVYE